MFSTKKTNPVLKIKKGTYRKLTDKEKALLKTPENNFTTYEYVVTKSFTFRLVGGKKITIPEGFVADGASNFALDVGISWLLHDWLYATHRYDDQTKCSQDEADQLLSWILWDEGRIWRCYYWYIALYLFGDSAWKSSHKAYKRKSCFLCRTFL